MRRWAAFIYRYHKAVLVLAVAGLPIAAFLAAGAIDALTVGILGDPNAESSRAERILEDDFDQTTPQVVVLATATQGSVDEPAAAEAGLALTDQLADEEGVGDAVSYWSLGNAPPLRSADGTQALVLVNLDAQDESERHEIAKELASSYNAEGDQLTTSVGGEAEVARQATEQVESDLQRAEAISIPLTMIALVIVFGGIVAALLPLGLGVISILLTLAILNLIAQFTDVSVFALNLTTALGLGLAIDYSLFIVSRLREERSHGYDTRRALMRTMQTAGRTVAFSAGTVAVSLSALFLFPTPYLRSFGFAGVAVVITAAIASLAVLPALLAVLGDKVNSLRLFHRKRVEVHEGFWYRQSHRVMAHPWPVVIVITLFLLLLAVPFLRVSTGLVDDRVLPESLTSREVTDAIRQNFESREASALTVVVPGIDASDQADAIEGLALSISQLEGVSRVDAATGYYLDGVAVPPDDLSGRFVSDAGTWLSVVPEVEPYSNEGETLAKVIREVPTDLETLVGGPSAELVDTKQTVANSLPVALAFIALVTFALLFMMVGSLLVPLKALILNTLSLTATFGAMVWIFQDGNLSGLLGFTPTGFIDTFTPILMFCVAFGLSMDYEVFVLSRIKEEYDLTGDNTQAVATGLQKTGGIVTAAAALLAIVFLGIATSSVSVAQMLGIGLSLAVIVDAFFIRATLVPALMKLAGRANWWAPRWLRRFHLRYGIFESDPIELLDMEDEPEQSTAPEQAPQSTAGD